MAEILVVDDEVGIRELLSEILGDEGHGVLLADGAGEARRLRHACEVDLVLLDIWMPETDGLTLLKQWSEEGLLTMPVIMMSGHATIDTAVEATRIGALDFLEKPISLQKLLKTVENGLARGRLAPAKNRRSALATAPAVGSRPSSGAESLLRATAFETAPDGSLPDSVWGPTRASTAMGLTDSPPVAASSVRLSAPALENLPLSGREVTLEQPLREARDAFERAYFEYHLARENGSMTRVAERTGLERTHLYRKLKQLGIDFSRNAFRKNGPGTVL